MHAPPGPPVLRPYDTPDHPLAPWFADLREERESRRRAPRATRRAVVTIVHDEPVFLPIWLGYYGRFFAPADIYVLDHETTDGSTDRDGFVRIPVHHDSVDHTWMVEQLQGLQHALLDSYDVVLVTDVDEIVAPVPEWGTLGDYLDRFDEGWVNPLGYELLHLPDREPPLDLGRPILDQRGFWYQNDAYSKAALATEPMTWLPGLHGRADRKLAVDPDLRLVHLHRMDHDLCLARHRTRARRPWAPHDRREGWAAHNRIVDEAAFTRWFLHDSGFAGHPPRPEPIGASWRGLF